MSLFGRWNWWLPVWAARIMRVEPHAAVPEQRRGGVITRQGLSGEPEQPVVLEK